MASVLAPATLAVALVTYRDLKGSANVAPNPVSHLPIPSRFVSVAIVFGALALFTGGAAVPAQLAAWGLDVAILLNLWTPGGAVKSSTSTTTGATP